MLYRRRRAGLDLDLYSLQCVFSVVCCKARGASSVVISENYASRGLPVDARRHAAMSVRGRELKLRE